MDRAEDGDGHAVGKLAVDTAAADRDAEVVLRQGLVDAARQLGVRHTGGQDQVVRPREIVNQDGEASQLDQVGRRCVERDTVLAGCVTGDKNDEERRGTQAGSQRCRLLL